MLTHEEIQDLKKQLFTQIQHLPNQQREEAEKQIEEMSPEALELMVRQQTQGAGKSVLRMIVEGTIPSRRIDQNKNVIAVLEIRPITKGHVLIIPLEPVHSPKQVPAAAFSLAKKIAKRIQSKLKPKGIEIQTETKLGEQIINVIPYLDKPVSIHAPRTEASEKELDDLQRLLATKPRAKVEKKIKYVETPTKIVLKRRIP